MSALPDRGDWRVLVTGGSGFVGTNLVGAYAGAGAAVLNVDVAPPRNPAHVEQWRRIDLLDRAGLARELRAFAPTHVLHMGARTDLTGRGVGAYAANTTGVANLLGAIAGAGSVRRVVFASSRMVCRIGYQPGDEEDYCPPNAYGESKVAGERLVRAAGLDVPWTIVRPTSIWGPWFDVPYKDFFLTVARGRYVHVRGRRVPKSFGFVGNTVHQLDRLLAAEPPQLEGRTVYLADYPPLEVGDWAERVCEALGAPRIRTLPLSALRPVALAGDALQRLGRTNVPLTSFRLDNLLTPMVHDLSPLEEVAGELPYSLDAGIAETVAWLRDRGEA